MEKTYDIAVIGSGPGGYVAAIRAAQLGKNVMLIEKERIGGTCMNWGCIPTKHLLHATRLYRDMRNSRYLKGAKSTIRCDWTAVQQEKQQRVDRLIQGIEFLLEKNGIRVIRGRASLEDSRRIRIQSEKGISFIQADQILLATGSRPACPSFLAPDGKHILTSREALELSKVPESLLIVGAGAIGLEMGTVFQRLGCRVTLVEILGQILPGVDRGLARRLERLLKRQGMDIRTSMKLGSAELIEQGECGVVVNGVCQKTKNSFSLKVDKVLVAAGRRAEVQACETAPLRFDEQGFLLVNPQLQTDLPEVYAIGDLIGGKLLAHEASHQGIWAVENMFQGTRHDYRDMVVPMVVYTEPELACVGMQEGEARERFGDGIKLGSFSLQANGRALTMGEQEGLVRVVADPDERVVGAQILAPLASEIIMELTLAVRKGLSLMDIGETVHPHPTLSEAVMEAALHGRKRAVHTLNL